MNTTKHTLTDIIVTSNQVYYVVKACIHTILFNRLLGNSVRAKDVSCPLFDSLNYTMIDSEEIERKVHTILMSICNKRDKDTLTIYLLLYIEISKYGFLGEYKEKIEWERWCMKVTISNRCDEEKINQMIDTILDQCMSHHTVPLIKNVSFDITTSTEKETSFFDLFRSVPRI